MTPVTKSLVKILIEDSIKISEKENFAIPFNRYDLRNMLKNADIKDYKTEFKIGESICTFFDAGHIPGSAGILIENKKKIFYTGDFYKTDSELIRGHDFPESCDVLITESTYGTKNHKPRNQEKENLIKSVEDVIKSGGKVLLPVLSIGRAQEILMVLRRFAPKIALDGMAQKATKTILSNPRSLKNPEEFKKMLGKIKWVKSDKSRNKVFEKYPILITSSGMLGGGPAVKYLKKIRTMENSKVILTSFQADDSPGKGVLENKIFDDGNEKFKIIPEIEQYDFSGHSDKDDIIEIIKKMNPKTIILVHGDKCVEFKEDLEKIFPTINILAPKNGEEIDLE